MTVMIRFRSPGDGEPLPHYKDHVSVTKRIGKSGRERTVHWCSTVRKAETFIAKYAERNAKAKREVESGMFSINPDLHASRVYDRQRQRAR